MEHVEAYGYFTPRFAGSLTGKMGTRPVYPAYRNKGLEAVLYLEALKTGKKRQIKGGELSWTLEDNAGINKGIEAMGGKLIKKYRIYEKKLA